MHTVFKYILFVACVAAIASCAAVQPPFASPEEIAIKQKLTEDLAQYRNLRITVSGDRVYLEGDVLDKAELDHARSVAQEAQGVNVVMDDVLLLNVGPMNYNDWHW